MLTRFPRWSASLLQRTCTGVLLVTSLALAHSIGTHHLYAADRNPAVVPRRVLTPEALKAMEEEDVENDEQADGKTKLKQTAAADDAFASEEPPPRIVGNGYGAMSRAGFLGGKTFGRNDSIVPFEVLPYMLTDTAFVFADVRGFVTTRSQGGGNFGVGYRRLLEDRNAWYGASFWYDADQSTSKMFQQVGLSFEGLVRQWEMRGNVYLPFTTTQNISNTFSTGTIVGNQLLYTHSITNANPLRGVDLEGGRSWLIQDRHIVRGFVGAYFFDGASTSAVNGVKVRGEAVINNAVTAQAMFTHDKLYGSNLMVGLSMQFPFGKDHPNTGWFRNTPSPFRFVERNYNVIVDRQTNTSGPLVATDPTTGNPYVIDQVYAPSGGGGGGSPDGTSANPFSSVAAAQAAGGDVIFVQNGSVLTQPITLTAGQHLFGQGNPNEFLTVAGGQVRMPTAVDPLQPGTGAAPIIQNIAGNAITLASNTDVAGFTITGGTGNAITGTGVSNVSIHDLIFNSLGGDAVNLTNASGTVALSNLQIASGTGNGIVFNGGNADITFAGLGNSISVQGDGFVLNGLTGGKVTLDNLTMNNLGGNGLVLNNVATDVTINSLSVSQSGLSGPGAAVAITGTTATPQTYTFGGTTTITSPNSTGFSASGSNANIDVKDLHVTSTSSQPAVALSNDTGTVTFSNLNVNTHNGTGLFADHVTNLIVSNGALTTVNAPAMDINATGLDARLGYVSVNGGPFGIRVVGGSGSLAVQAGGDYGSAGNIQNTTTAGIILNGFGNTTLRGLSLTNNAAGILSTGSSELLLSKVQITGSTGYALDSMNDLFLGVSNSMFSGNGAVGGGTMRIQADAVGTYTSSISSNNITDNNGSAILFNAQAGALGATLNSQILSNSIVGHGANGTLIGVDWNGPMVITVANNALYAYSSNMTGIKLQSQSLSAVVDENVSTNSIVFETTAATNGTGIYIIDGQSGQISTSTPILSMASNHVAFYGTGGTGIRFASFESTNDAITSNTVADYAGGATGMLFDNVGANSTMIIMSNTIGLKQGDATVHRGIIFSQISPHLNLATPTGATSNWIYNAASVATGISIPTGTGATGGILINGNYITAP